MGQQEGGMNALWFVLDGVAAVVKFLLRALDLAAQNQDELNSHPPMNGQRDTDW